jgi:hypothetical protein
MSLETKMLEMIPSGGRCALNKQYLFDLHDEILCVHCTVFGCRQPNLFWLNDERATAGSSPVKVARSRRLALAPQNVKVEDDSVRRRTQLHSQTERQGLGIARSKKLGFG